MKINEVEKRVQITKKNIRFYEQEGLLHPERNKENGYREYSEEDVDVLLKIKFLRKLSLPIEEIRMIQSKKLSLHDALRRHLITLEHEERNLQEEELLQLKYRLYYPEKFWKIVNFYYNSPKSWISCKNGEKLTKLLEQEEAKNTLMQTMFP